MNWLKNGQGMFLSPEKSKSERALEAKKRRVKKHKTNKDSYSGKKLTRLCPKCGSDVSKNQRTLDRNDAIGVYRDNTAVYVCNKCHAVWRSKQTIKVWQRLKKNPEPTSNKEFKAKLNAFLIMRGIMKKVYESPEIKIYRECNYCAICDAYVPCGAALCPYCKPEDS